MGIRAHVNVIRRSVRVSEVVNDAAIVRLESGDKDMLKRDLLELLSNKDHSEMHYAGGAYELIGSLVWWPVEDEWVDFDEWRYLCRS